MLTGAAVLVPVVAIGTLAGARPRRQVVAAFLPPFIVSIVVYGNAASGSFDFPVAVIVCGILSIAFAFVLTQLQAERHKFATYAWALLGVVAPYALAFTLVGVACWGKTDCL